MCNNNFRLSGGMKEKIIMQAVKEHVQLGFFTRMMSQHTVACALLAI